MKQSHKGYGTSVIFIVLIFGAVLFSGWLIYRSNHMTKAKDSASSYGSKALMIVTSNGGYCVEECKHPTYNLYEDGKFEGHSKLSKTEISELKNIINTTDLLKYNPNPQPRCDSFVDGTDQVLFFPKKYDKKSFTPCMLDIKDNDHAFSYIKKLIETHDIQQN